MAYNSAIPAATDRLIDSQAALLANFAAIKTLIDVNHVTFDDASGNQGKHAYVSLPEQAASPTTAADEVAIFSRLSTLTATSELAIRKEGNGDVVEFTSCKASGCGWARLPSGILLKWGNSSANGSTTITFPVAADTPAFTTIFSINLTTWYENTSDGDGFVRLGKFAAPWTTFKAYGSKRTSTTNKLVSFQYLAIGI